MQDFVPADHDFLVLAHDLLQAPVEMGLKRMIVVDSVLLHEVMDGDAFVPLFAIYLVAAYVEILVRKQLRHFSDEFVQKTIDMFVGGVYGGIETSPSALDLIRPGCA